MLGILIWNRFSGRKTNPSIFRNEAAKFSNSFNIFSWFQSRYSAWQFISLWTNGSKCSIYKIIFRFFGWCNINVISDIYIIFSAWCRWDNWLITNNNAISWSTSKRIIRRTSKCIGMNWTNYHFNQFMLMGIFIYHYMARVPFIKEKSSISIVFMNTLGSKTILNVTCTPFPRTNATNWFRDLTMSSH